MKFANPWIKRYNASRRRLLKMEVVTEGVKTEKRLLMLSEMGIICYRDIIFLKPIPVAEHKQNIIYWE